ncbi:hypothetical protein J3Q64DRAFT_1214970 [Phycomyces blakesleeanus]|uniref:RING-type domain-containing protein n=2 Tax=Phycomyces blakesleeanus TaxID=4837 RepID=A0A162UXJ6_PHYB8|nr:hypothetical protein PHYBLDRAFT_179618 [Phycomyces blakesleeanus NRRL 1555(-)]OAD78623.1 hypothetical protein PHYBLDRAFT_179618 [Phycomyces blakesleeanus NRRL 1555(-)]|eukprot:XP_018296663.1 hypothetical protein PHYBLDRAFT_179618 [Phycomyces blakesleeanus NRRL 1555(-)]
MSSSSTNPDPAIPPQTLSNAQKSRSTTKRRSKGLHRELQFLVDDNGKRAKRDQPKCPICEHRIDPAHWEIHFNYELERLGQLESDIYNNPLNKNRGKRGAAVVARQQLEKTNHKKRAPSAYESTLEKIQKNRAHRKEVLQKLDSPRQLEDSAAAYDETLALTRALYEEEQGSRQDSNSNSSAQVCFICNQALHGDSDAVNLHIDHCLANLNSSVEPEDTEDEPMIDNTENESRENSGAGTSPLSARWEEYEWAGQTRVRATSMMEGGYRGAGFATTSKEEDVDEDLDVEDDDAAQFGESQYTERDIVVNSDDDNENASALREMVSGGMTRGSTATASVQDGDEGEVDSPRSGFEETVSDAGWERHLTHSNQMNSNSGQSRLVVDSLKARIQQLEAASRSVPRCLICLEGYKTPLASIVCWHVHCEQCWLQTLGSKKLCPQCQKITTPSDLRRIYF